MPQFIENSKHPKFTFAKQDIRYSLPCNKLLFCEAGGIGTIVPGLFLKLRQRIYYEIGDEQQSKVGNMDMID